MCRWIAYLGEPATPDRFLSETEYCLVAQSQAARKSVATVNGDGFGLGWYERETTPGVFRDVLPMWGDENLRSIAQQIRPSTFMAHVRAATDTATIRLNCHPFTYAQFLFMHNGQIGGYPRVRRQLEHRLDDRFYASRQGSTDSELIFLLLLQLGAESDFAGAAQAIIHEVETIQSNVDEEDPFRFTAAFTDGQQLHAIRYSSDEHPPTLFYRHSETGSVVVSEPLDDQEQRWTILPANHTLIVERGAQPVATALSN